MTTPMSLYTIHLRAGFLAQFYEVRETRVTSPFGSSCPEGFAPAHGENDDEALTWVAKEPTACVDDLEAARAVVKEHRPGLLRMPPLPDDDPSLIEVWI